MFVKLAFTSPKVLLKLYTFGVFHYKVGPLLSRNKLLRLNDVRVLLQTVQQIEFRPGSDLLFEVTISHHLGGVKLIFLFMAAFLDNRGCPLPYLLQLLVFAQVVVLGPEELDFIRLGVLQSVGR